MHGPTGPPTGPPPIQRLRRSIGVLDGWAVAASSTAATTSIGIGMGLLAGVVGVQLPILLILAFLPMLGIAGAYARLNRDEPNCGNGYTWVGVSLGPWLGFLTGWLLLVGVILFLAYTCAIVGSVLLQLAAKFGLHSIGGVPLDPNATLVCTLIGLVVLALVAVTAATGLAKAARFQVVLLGFEYVTIVGFCLVGIVFGHQPFEWAWFNPFGFASVTALTQGLVLAVFIYWGWDAAFSVTEETTTPGASARSGYLTLCTALALFLTGAIAFQRVLSPAELVAHPADALAYFAARLAAEPWATLPLLALLLSAVASMLAALIPTARQALAMGRDATLGSVWTRVHPKYGTPAAATGLAALVAVLIAMLSVAIPQVGAMVLASINAVGILVALYYGLTALACAVRFRALLRAGPGPAVKVVVVPALSGLVMFGIGGVLVHSYLTKSAHLALDPDNGYFQLLCPGVVIALGLVVAAVAKWGRRSDYFRTGRGTDDLNLDLSTPEADRVS
jgi:amino acid transporter